MLTLSAKGLRSVTPETLTPYVNKASSKAFEYDSVKMAYEKLDDATKDTAKKVEDKHTEMHKSLPLKWRSFLTKVGTNVDQYLPPTEKELREKAKAKPTQPSLLSIPYEALMFIVLVFYRLKAQAVALPAKGQRYANTKIDEVTSMESVKTAKARAIENYTLVKADYILPAKNNTVSFYTNNVQPIVHQTTESETYLAFIDFVAPYYERMLQGLDDLKKVWPIVVILEFLELLRVEIKKRIPMEYFSGSAA